MGTGKEESWQRPSTARSHRPQQEGRARRAGSGGGGAGKGGQERPTSWTSDDRQEQRTEGEAVHLPLHTLLQESVTFDLERVKLPQDEETGAQERGGDRSTWLVSVSDSLRVLQDRAPVPVTPLVSHSGHLERKGRHQKPQDI